MIFIIIVVNLGCFKFRKKISGQVIILTTRVMYFTDNLKYGAIF